MKKLIYISALLCLLSCQGDTISLQWINQTENLDYSNYDFRLSSNDINSVKACYIYTGIQASKLILNKGVNEIMAKVPNDKTLFTGPARLVVELSNEETHIFQFNGLQKTPNDIKDFRTPKSFIADSSLNQQQIIYAVNESRNMTTTKPASENWFALAPNQSEYIAQAIKKETTYYVESGSVTNLFIQHDAKAQMVTTNTLKDKFGNVITDGTQATFFIIKNNEEARIECQTKEGKAIVKLPDYIHPPYSVQLAIGLASSNKIEIQ